MYSTHSLHRYSRQMYGTQFKQMYMEKVQHSLYRYIEDRYRSGYTVVLRGDTEQSSNRWTG